MGREGGGLDRSLPLPTHPRTPDTGGERVTGGKARGLQMEEIGCKHQTYFYLSLKWQEETNYVSGFFFS